MTEQLNVARLERGTERWVAQTWDAEQKRFVDVVPLRDATDEEIEALEGTHPLWSGIQPSGKSDHHWVTFDDADSWLARVHFHCDAPEGSDCRWTCPADCEAFPCYHPPEPSDCWAAPFFEGNHADDVFEEESLEKQGIVQKAVIDVEWEGDYAVAAYRLSDMALDEDRYVVTR